MDNLQAIPGGEIVGNFRLFCVGVAHHCSFGQYVSLMASWSFEG